jgi:hypothetical protein
MAIDAAPSDVAARPRPAQLLRARPLRRCRAVPTARFDVLRFVTVADGLVCLLLALTEGQSWGWTSYTVLSVGLVTNSRAQIGADRTALVPPGTPMPAPVPGPTGRWPVHTPSTS